MVMKEITKKIEVEIKKEESFKKIKNMPHETIISSVNIK